MMRDILCVACRSSMCKERSWTDGGVPMAPPCGTVAQRKSSLNDIALARQPLIEKLEKYRALLEREDELRMKLDRTSIDALRLRKITLAHARPLSASTTCLLEKQLPPQIGASSASNANRITAVIPSTSILSQQSAAEGTPEEGKSEINNTRARPLSGHYDGTMLNNHNVGESLLRRRISSVTSPAAVRLRNAQEKAAQRKRSLAMLDEDLFRVQSVLARARRLSQEDLLSNPGSGTPRSSGQLVPERSASDNNLADARSSVIRRELPGHQCKRERPTSTYY